MKVIMATNRWDTFRWCVGRCFGVRDFTVLGVGSGALAARRSTPWNVSGSVPEVGAVSPGPFQGSGTGPDPSHPLGTGPDPSPGSGTNRHISRPGQQNRGQQITGQRTITGQLRREDDPEPGVKTAPTPHVSGWCPECARAAGIFV